MNCGGLLKGEISSDHFYRYVNTLTYTPSLPFLTTMEPADTLLMGDEDSSTTPASETDEFIKSSTNDLVPIPREFEVTSGNNLECGMPIDTPSSPYLVVLRDEKINLILRDDLDTLLMGDREIDFNPYTSSDLSPALLPTESSLLVLSPLASKQFSLWNVERFDPFSPLDTARVKDVLMKTPSFGFHYMA
ncbi:hypothetical protein Tco_1285787 [Tanacetum coccineum]